MIYNSKINIVGKICLQYIMAANNQLIMNCNLYPGVRNPYIHPFSTMAMINYNSSLIQFQASTRVTNSQESLQIKITLLKCELNVP